jgi:hypothetical protein
MMENGTRSAARAAGDSLHISLTYGLTKHRTQILKSLQQDLEDAGMCCSGGVHNAAC